MQDFVKNVLAENPDLNVYEWIAEGWGLNDQPAPEQVAAALLMEATTADLDVQLGNSAPEFPVRLRKLAKEILEHFHPSLA